MKIVLQSFILSLVFHFLYFAGTFLFGYIQTQNYVPNIDEAWSNVDVLQNEVAFGTMWSPYFFLLTFLGGALICGLTNVLYQRLKLWKTRRC